MGNICGVSGSNPSHMVYSPDRTNHDDGGASQLGEAMRTLRNESGLTSSQHEYLSNTAPQALRQLHNRLVHETEQTMHLAGMQHAHLTGQDTIRSGYSADELAHRLNDLSERWSGMRDTIQTAQNSNVSNGKVVLNPSGSMRWGRE